MRTMHRWLLPALFAAAWAAAASQTLFAAQPTEKGPWHLGPLGCRASNYGKYEPAAWSHMPSIGLQNIFLSAPAPDQVEALQRRLAEHGLKVAVMHSSADLTTPTGVDGLAPHLESCRRMGVHYLFLSPKHPGVSNEDACQRLRRAGELAKKHDVTLVLETHPDLGTNADVHLETMKRINHPNVRVNFDTGNISFYNQGRNAVDELRKIIDYVATVEIKDHSGKPMDWDFPTLGHGVVDIRGVLGVLKEHDFRGPVTIEIEGTHGIELTEEQTKRSIADSVAYLRSAWGATMFTTDPYTPKRLVAETYESGFALAHDTYNGLSRASDGKIYYVLSSESYENGAQMYVFDPSTKKTRHVADITEACGEKGKQTICQGKSHVNFVERRGKLYFATHLGYYSIIDDMEKPGIPPPGWKPYPGGHLLAYDCKTEKIEDLATEPHGEGILSMTMDANRERIYGITWPGGHVFSYDLPKRQWKPLGQFSRQGENGKGDEYRTVCRSLAVDPRDGSVYFTTGDGDIFRYRYDSETVEKVPGDDMRKDYFGQYDPTSAGHMGYNWRQAFWFGPLDVIYAIHGNSGYLLRFDPRLPRVEVLERITSLPSKRSGMFDQFSYGYLGFCLGPDGRTIYYLTGGPIYKDGKRVKGKDKTGKGEARGLEDLHLVTYDIPTGRYIDRGAIFYKNGQRPLYVNSIAVGFDGTVYTLARITENGRTRTDLIGVRP